MNITVDDHPLLDPVLLQVRWPRPLGDLETLPNLATWFSEDAEPPLSRPDAVKPAVRDLLRHGGFKPSGRAKPASEYLVKAVERGVMGSINPAVDCCNVASLWSGLPFSVVDVHKSTGPWRIGLAKPDTVYVFNPSGQEINISGLVSLFDAEGPCGGPVKDSQRTKTHDGTVLTLSIVWGTKALSGRSEATAEWYTQLMTSQGAQVERIKPAMP